MRYRTLLAGLHRFALAAVFALGASLPAFATVVSDQTPVPLTSAGGSELLTQSQAVTGGTLYTTVLRESGAQGQPIGVTSTFVSSAAAGKVRYLPLTGGKSDAGVSLTGTATGGAVGVSRTAGTSLTLVGEATSASAKTDKVMWEFNHPDSYVAGANIPVTVNCVATGGTITAASTTMTVAAYTETNGAEAALTVSSAQQIPATAGNLTFTITGTSLTPGQHVSIELVMLVTTSAGAGTGTINSVSYQG
jgi:hypothetical protein